MGKQVKRNLKKWLILKKSIDELYIDYSGSKRLATYCLVVPRADWEILPCESLDIPKLYEDDPSLSIPDKLSA